MSVSEPDNFIFTTWLLHKSGGIVRSHPSDQILFSIVSHSEPRLVLDGHIVTPFDLDENIRVSSSAILSIAKR
jgi:hypothetical protein